MILYKCDRLSLQNRIVGGTDATVHEFPYQAMLVNNDGDLQCGATISEFVDLNFFS